MRRLKKRTTVGAKPLFIALGIVLLLLILPVAVFFSQQQQQTQQQAATGFPTVQGNKIIDGTGNPLMLRGVQIPSEFNEGWHGGGSITTVLGTQVMAAIHSWGANALRLPVGAYEYQQAGYMTALDSVVQSANQHGLYVILTNFEDGQAMGGNSVLDQQGLKFWQFMASHYANNPMVMFDLINEPKNASYAEWLNGGGNVVGMQQTVSAIRGAGGKQIIVAEAIDTGTTFFRGFSSFINDPNVMYSLHIYFKDTTERSTSGWDTEFGTLAQTHPVLVGEWGLIPNDTYPSFCQGLDATSGTQLVQSFLSYMEQHNVNWTAWAFNKNHLVLDTTSFTPTTLNAPWCCGQGPVCSAGMGQLIKTYLQSTNGVQPTSSVLLTPTPIFNCLGSCPTPTSSPTVSSNPTASQPMQPQPSGVSNNPQPSTIQSRSAPSPTPQSNHPGRRHVSGGIRGIMQQLLNIIEQLLRLLASLLRRR